MKEKVKFKDLMKRGNLPFKTKEDLINKLDSEEAEYKNEKGVFGYHKKVGSIEAFLYFAPKSKCKKFRGLFDMKVYTLKTGIIEG